MRRQRAQLRNRLDAAPVVTADLSLVTGTIPLSLGSTLSIDDAAVEKAMRP